MEELTSAQEKELLVALDRLKDRLEDTLSQVSASSDTVKLDQQAFGRVSRGDALQQQSMAKASLAQVKDRYKQVLKAKARFDSDDYGFCLSCDKSIGFPRLQARPETPLCLHCQSAAENL